MTTGAIFTFFAFITSFVIVFRAIPSIIDVSGWKGLGDRPDGKRKLHRQTIPNLGGVALFGGFLISYGIWVGVYSPPYLHVLVASLLILFFIGVKDDLHTMNNYNKVLCQFIAAGIIVFIGGIKIPGLDGLMGITTFPLYAGEFFSIFTIVIIINAYNLIDGVDGLAGMITALGCSVFGVWFLAGGHYTEAILSFSMVGALAGFIWYNFQPAKIFMGDTGSQLLGFIMAVSGFRLVQLNATTPGFLVDSPAVFIFSVMIIPMFDTLRVIIVRLYKGVSPMKADRNHLHHSLLRLGLSPAKITLYLSLFNVVIVLTGLFINSWNVHLYLIAVLLMAATILPVMRGVRMLGQLSFRMLIKSESQARPEVEMDSHILGRSVSERKARDRQIIAESKPRIKVKLLNQENGFAPSRRKL